MGATKTEAFGRPFSADPKDWTYSREAKRTVPMQVLVLGLPRTGTSSMVQALRILGYRDVHHMSSCIANPPDDDLWLRAIKAKWFGQGKQFTRAEWDMLLGDCMATTDFPSAAFAEDLIAAYPEVKVILNNRPVDDWYRSVSETIGVALGSVLINVLARSGDPFWSRFTPMTRAMWSGFFDRFGYSMMDETTLKRRYLEHYQAVRDLVPKERLLEKDLTEGWERMAEFLGKEVPEVPYPRVNDKLEFGRSMQVMIGAGIQRLIRKLIALVALAMAFMAGVCLLRSVL